MAYPGWFKDDSKRRTRKFASYEQAVAAAERALRKARANNEQTQDRFYVADGWGWSLVDPDCIADIVR